MTKNNSFKKQIRNRMKATGETYTQARDGLHERTFSLAFLIENGLVLPLNDPSPSDVAVEDLFRGKELHDLNTSLATKSNIIVYGGMDTGKTLTLNAILNSYNALNSDSRVITIEEKASELYFKQENHVSLTATDDVSLAELLHSALRMRPDAVAVGEIQTNSSGMRIVKSITSQGMSSFATCHAQTFLHLASFAGGNFPDPTTVVMVDRLRIGEHVLFLRSVIPLTDEIKDAMEDFYKKNDQKKFYAALDALGVVTIDSKRRKLADLGIIK